MKQRLVLLTAIFACACGGGGGGTAPTPPVVAPTISGNTDLIFIGQTITFTAVGTNVRWGGDNPNVATVDATSGRVTGIGNGRVTIWAENDGGRTTRLLRGLPNFGGSWRGNYAVVDCQSALDFSRAAFCRNFARGQVLNIGFDMTQDRDRVTGSFAFGELQGTLDQGTISEQGVLPLTGRISEDGVTVTLENLRAESPSAGTMSGGFEQVWASSGLSGHGRLFCDLRSMTRTAGGPAILAPVSPLGLTSLDDVIRAALRR